MKFFYLLSIVFILFISNINADNLLIHKRIIPISLLQIKDIVNKYDKKILIVIVAKQIQIEQAFKFKELLPKTIKTFKLKAVIVKDKDLQYYSLKNQDFIDAFYCFDLSDNSYKFLDTFTKTNHIPSFSNTLDGLKKGNLLYIEFKNKIKIFINLEVFKKTKINFNNQFMQMVDIYDK